MFYELFAKHSHNFYNLTVYTGNGQKIRTFKTAASPDSAKSSPMVWVITVGGFKDLLKISTEKPF